MYNMLMSGNDEAFDQSPWSLEKSRFGEYSEENIVAPFASLDRQAIDRLKSLPTLFWYERSNKKGARVGWIDAISVAGGALRVSFSFDPFIPEIPFDVMVELAEAVDIRLSAKFSEGNRTHWAVKDADLIHVLADRKLMNPRNVSPYAPYAGGAHTTQRPAIIVRPQYFEIPPSPVDRTLVSVMMPFGSPFTPVYAAIGDAAAAAGMWVQRADDIWNHSVLMQDIFGLIYRSQVVVCDFSEKNPNVFYEAGIAHMLGRHVVPITQSHDDVPFDLKPHRYIHYLNNGEGLAKMGTELQARLQTLSKA
ncbi:hypothetical protein HGP14_30800 [Rhizobium sp. P32RR-XVIII]|uniref:hypothetical protein n=1 Tax=Rhizobium sp. P32RR-XVIII TaxID=2726738 RepID=UPI001456BF0E|nr:hypothetical protein [Rhizobium sp. P32RR-XVIII]NLS07651.1 hypothetical protein [Rhizobium sp. P32RR-XVIII]